MKRRVPLALLFVWTLMVSLVLLSIPRSSSLSYDSEDLVAGGSTKSFETYSGHHVSSGGFSAIKASEIVLIDRFAKLARYTWDRKCAGSVLFLTPGGSVHVGPIADAKRLVVKGDVSLQAIRQLQGVAAFEHLTVIHAQDPLGVVQAVSESGYEIRDVMFVRCSARALIRFCRSKVGRRIRRMVIEDLQSSGQLPLVDIADLLSDLSQLPSLESLAFRLSTIPPDGYMPGYSIRHLSRSTTLKELEYMCLDRLQPEDLIAFQKIPTFQHVILKWPRVDERVALEMTNIPNLKRCELIHPDTLPGVFWNQIGDFKKLESFTIVGASVPRSGVVRLLEIPKLKNLVLRDVSLTVGDNNVSQIAPSLQRALSNSSVESLDIRGSGFGRPEEARTVFGHWRLNSVACDAQLLEHIEGRNLLRRTRLRNLTLHGVIGREGIQKIGEMPNLRSLEIQRLKSDFASDDIVKMSSIARLHIESFEGKMDGAQVESILTLPNLRFLSCEADETVLKEMTRIFQETDSFNLEKIRIVVRGSYTLRSMVLMCSAVPDGVTVLMQLDRHSQDVATHLKEHKIRVSYLSAD